jgi:hypothetical protein
MNIDAHNMKNFGGDFIEQAVAQSAITLSFYLAEEAYKYFGPPIA